MRTEREFLVDVLDRLNLAAVDCITSHLVKPSS